MPKAYWKVLSDTQLGDIPNNNPTREKDYYDAFQSQCLYAALDPDCLGILGLGDLRERPSIHPKNLEGLNSGIHTLYQAKKPLLALMGNHDLSDPNWITAMHHPGLEDLTCPKARKNWGLPTTIVASHFQKKNELHEWLASIKTELAQAKLIFLHQSFQEFTTNLRQSYDISLEDLKKLGVGENGPCLVLSGDIHNYGDAKLDNLTAISPGSLEMTDSNEGALGLRTQKYQSEPCDFQKFTIKLYPPTSPEKLWEWEREAANPRPWYYSKAKDKKMLEIEIQRIITASNSWQKPGMVTLKVPKPLITDAQEALKNLNTLTLDIQILKPNEISEDTLIPETSGKIQGWPDTKVRLEEMVQKSQLSQPAKTLLSTIIKEDQNNPSAKADVRSAWDKWTSTMREPAPSV